MKPPLKELLRLALGEGHEVIAVIEPNKTEMRVQQVTNDFVVGVWHMTSDISLIDPPKHTMFDASLIHHYRITAK